MAEIRVFLANAIRDEGEILTELRERAQRLLLAMNPDATSVTVTTGKEDYEANIQTARLRNPAEGGWKEWSWMVAAGVLPAQASMPALDFSPTAGEPKYHACVCPHLTIGRATAMIALGFREIGKPVYYMGGTALHLVQQVITVNPKDRANGWTLADSD